MTLKRVASKDQLLSHTETVAIAVRMTSQLSAMQLQHPSLTCQLMMTFPQFNLPMMTKETQALLNPVQGDSTFVNVAS